MLFISLFLSCSSNEKEILGKWKSVSESDGTTMTQICTFSSNKTETCDCQFSMYFNGDLVSVDYIITQEWYFEKDTIIEKMIDSRIKSIKYGNDNLYPKDSLYNTLSNIILSRMPNGMTASRKVVIKKDSFVLDEGESQSVWTRME